MTPCLRRLRGDTNRDEGNGAATRLVISGRRGPWPYGHGRTAPNTHADSGGPAPQNRAAVPGTTSRPVPIRIRSRLRGHSKCDGLTSSRGGASLARLTGGAGRWAFPPSRGAAAGVGWTLG